MIEKDTKKRITALEALQDKWFKINKQKKTSNKLLAKNVLSNMKKWEEMLYNVPKIFEEMPKIGNLVLNELNIYEMKSKKNNKNVGRKIKRKRKKTKRV